MSGLLRPGAHRAGDRFDDAAVLRAMVSVEQAWLTGLVAAGIAPAAAAAELATPGGDVLDQLTVAGEATGNPVPALVTVLRDGIRPVNPTAAGWLHRGLTSQDVLDSALMLCARAAATAIGEQLRQQARSLIDLADRHRDSVMAGRTLTQFAVPITFGLKAATWLEAVVDAAQRLDAAAGQLPAQLGGAAGTLSALTELAGRTGADRPLDAAMTVATHTAERLGLRFTAPWHTSRGAMTNLADALVTCCDAWGRIAGDVLTLSRPEIAELAEPAGPGRGGSSTMPHKTNPVLSVLIRRTALSAPLQGAQLHLAAAEARDERPDGSWHSEWPALQDLVRDTAAAADQASELLGGLHVDTHRMRATARAAAGDLLAERASLDALAPADKQQPDPQDYLGLADLFTQRAIDLGTAYLASKENPR